MARFTVALVAFLAMIGNLFTPPATAARTAAETGAATTGAAPVAVFLGDSYTDANGAPGGWAELLSAAMGWTERNLAYGGTGYVTPYIGPLGWDCPPWPGGFRCPPFIELVDAAGAANPAVIIVLGGRNELGQESSVEWVAGVHQMYAALRAAAPHAAIYGLSPLWDDDPTPAGILEMRTVVRSAVESVQGCYVDMLDPLLGRPDLVYDGIHPNAAGNAALRDAFLANAPGMCVPVAEPRERPAPTTVPMPEPGTRTRPPGTVPRFP